MPKARSKFGLKKKKIKPLKRSVGSYTSGNKMMKDMGRLRPKTSKKKKKIKD